MVRKLEERTLCYVHTASAVDPILKTERQVSDLRESMLSFHREGLERFVKVIDANPGYDDLIANKISNEFREEFDESRGIGEKVARALAVNQKQLLDKKKSLKVIRPDFPGAVCFGSTSNNLREFEWFERLCSNPALKILQRNLQEYPTLRKERGPDVLQLSALILRDVEEFYGSRSSITPGVVHQQMLYTSTFLNWLVAFTEKDVVMPGLMVLANDHAPAHVAISMLMKGAGVPRVYIQHAEVTPAFPPLDFEYCLLRNKRSLDIYKSLGPIPKGTYVIPRAETPFAAEKLAKDRGPVADVVIYPTSRVIPAKLKEIVSALKANQNIEHICVKPHPGSAPIVAETLAGMDVPIVSKVLNNLHVAIVGNSSVVVELLHMGVPVYQNYDFDPVEADYYGFSRSGLTPAVSLSQLRTRFWTPYAVDNKWTTIYSELNPAASPDYEKDRAEFLAAMNELLARISANQKPLPPYASAAPALPPLPRALWKRASLKMLRFIVHRRPAVFLRVVSAVLRYTKLGQQYSVVKRSGGQTVGMGTRAKSASSTATSADLIVLSLSGSRDPGTWLRLAVEMATFDEVEIMLAINRLMIDRDMCVNQVLGCADQLPADSALRLWLLLKGTNWSLRVMPRDRLSTVAAEVYSSPLDHPMRRQLEKELLLLLLRSGEPQDVRAFADRAQKVRLSDFSTNFKIDILRKLSADESMQSYVRDLRKSFEVHSSRFHRLKYKNMDVLTGMAPVEWNHAYMVEQFATQAPQSLAEQFNAEIRPIYAKLGPRMVYMDIRTDTRQCGKLKALIRTALVEKRPFSLVRLGDGEGYLMSTRGKHFTASDVSNRERHWWGVELPQDIRNKIIRYANQTLATADVVGMPSVHRFIRDHDDGSRSLTLTTQGRGLLDVLAGLERATSPQALFTEDRVNVCLFSDQSYLMELASLSKQVLMLSSIQPSNVPKAFTRLPQFSTLVVPTHYRSRGNDGYYDGDEPLPYVYESILADLEERVGPGALVLVAAGIIGKIFVGYAKRRGAVALDIGGVVNDWQGNTAKLR